MVSCPRCRRAAEGERLCKWRKRALPGGPRIERSCSRISWLVGRRELWRSFRQPSCDAGAIKHTELRAETFLKRFCWVWSYLCLTALRQEKTLPRDNEYPCSLPRGRTDYARIISALGIAYSRLRGHWKTPDL